MCDVVHRSECRDCSLNRIVGTILRLLHLEVVAHLPRELVHLLEVELFLGVIDEDTSTVTNANINAKMGLRHLSKTTRQIRIRCSIRLDEQALVGQCAEVPSDFQV